ncbi:unnamed protein product, partial [marine sediment metagenome]
ISTNSLELDIALGIGGIPRGRVTEIFGPEASGKTTLALHIIANAQKEEGVAAFIDAEHALDPGYARNVGVNIEELLLSQPDNGEQALEICEILLKSGALDVIVIDSVAALSSFSTNCAALNLTSHLLPGKFFSNTFSYPSGPNIQQYTSPTLLYSASGPANPVTLNA